MKLPLLFGLLSVVAPAEDWPMFRGPNGSGVSSSQGPAEFGLKKNLVWTVPVPVGHSSPVVKGDRIYLTGVEQERLVTLCLRRSDGKLLWQRECPRPRKESFDRRNNAASPTPAAEERNVYVFFPEFGLMSYTRDGAERWQLPLGPFDNYYGMGASPLLAGDLVALVCDQARGSFAIGVNKDDGAVKWKQDRKDAVSGHSTPVLYRPAGGPLQIVAPGSFRLDAYQAETGEVVWWHHGMASEMKSVAVVNDGTIFINGFNLPENDRGRQVTVLPFADMLAEDRNKDGQLSKDEITDERARRFFNYLDLDHSGALDAGEWRTYQQSMKAENGLLAIKGGGTGDVTLSHTLWTYHTSISQLPSVVVHQGHLYMVNDAGILAVLDPANGNEQWRGRLRAVPDRIFASPVAAGDKLYFVTQSGAVVVRKAGVEHEVIAVNELGEECYATPAIADGRIYVRTVRGLYAFGR